MGDVLKVDEARDAAFLLTGAGTCLGKSAYLTTDPMTLQEGKRAIARAISDHREKARGLGHPRINLPAQQPFWFNTSRASPPGDQSAHEVPKDRQTPRWPFHGRGCNRRRRDQRLSLKVIGVQSPWHLPYHPSRTIQMVLGIQDEAGDIGRKVA